jgi:hypothetical protein
MPKEKAVRFANNPGMMFVISFVLVALVNFVVIWFANKWFPNNVVVGTAALTPFWATLLFAGALSLLTVLFIPFLTWWEMMRKRNFAPHEMMIVYLLFNFASVWFITRKAEVFGVGVTSWMVVLGLALVLDIFQGLVMMQVEKWRLKP